MRVWWMFLLESRSGWKWQLPWHSQPLRSLPGNCNRASTDCHKTVFACGAKASALTLSAKSLGLRQGYSSLLISELQYLCYISSDCMTASPVCLCVCVCGAGSACVCRWGWFSSAMWWPTCLSPWSEGTPSEEPSTSSFLSSRTHLVSVWNATAGPSPWSLYNRHT